MNGWKKSKMKLKQAASSLCFSPLKVCLQFSVERKEAIYKLHKLTACALRWLEPEVFHSFSQNDTVAGRRFGLHQLCFTWIIDSFWILRCFLCCNNPFCWYECGVSAACRFRHWVRQSRRAAEPPLVALTTPWCWSVNPSRLPDSGIKEWKITAVI